MRVAASETSSSLVEDTSYGVCVMRHGTHQAVKAGDSVPTNALLVRPCSTSGVAVTNTATPSALRILCGAFGPRQLVRFNTYQRTLTAYGTTYRLELDFCAHEVVAHMKPSSFSAPTGISGRP